MRVVLMSGDGLQLLHCVNVEVLGAVSSRLKPLPGVVRWAGQVFIFNHCESEDSVVYNQAVELVLYTEPAVEIEKV